MPAEDLPADAVEQAARVGYETVMARLPEKYRTVMASQPNGWEDQPDDLKDDWRAIAGAMLTPVVADRDRLLPLLKRAANELRHCGYLTLAAEIDAALAGR